MGPRPYYIFFILYILHFKLAILTIFVTYSQSSHLGQPSSVVLLLFHIHHYPNLKYLTAPSTTMHLQSGIPYSVNLALLILPLPPPLLSPVTSFWLGLRLISSNSPIQRRQSSVFQLYLQPYPMLAFH